MLGESNTANSALYSKQYEYQHTAQVYIYSYKYFCILHSNEGEADKNK